MGSSKEFVGSIDISPTFKPLHQLGELVYIWKPLLRRGEFEEFCNACRIYFEDKVDLRRGELTAALFPDAFSHHLAAVMMASTGSATELPICFRNATNLVLDTLPYEKKQVQNGEFQFVDEASYGDPVDVDVVFRLGGLIAICHKCSSDSETSIEYCIVQHDLTGAYVCRKLQRSTYDEDLVMEKAIGILGLETTSDGINVENVLDDGSYYLGKLEDFSDKFMTNKKEESREATYSKCAYKLFGHLTGAEFLKGNEAGLKCSPLIAIALAIATNTEDLALKWNGTRGHMDAKNSSSGEFENCQWLILYMDKINELGLGIEWDMKQ